MGPDEVVQILLETLVEAIDKGHASSALQPGLMDSLLALARRPDAQWVRLCALAAIDLLAASLLERTVDELLKVPSALEALMQAVEDPVHDVRNQALVLLQRLSPHEQVKLFVTFCDGFQTLIKIAQAESPASASTDAVSVVFNALLGNLPGQRQFCDSPVCLAGLVELLDPACPPTAAVAVDCCRLLARGALPLGLATALSPPDDHGLQVRPVKDQQTRLGATPDLVSRLAALAFNEDSDLRGLATRTLGDVVCGHRANVALLERDCSGLGRVCVWALSQVRPVDAQANAYAWACITQSPETRIALVGHAVAPPPDDDGDDAVGLVVQALVVNARTVLDLRDKVYVDPATLAEARRKLWRSARLLEAVLGNDGTCREIALRLTVQGEPLLWQVLELCRSLIDANANETKSVGEASAKSALDLLRVLIVWVHDCEAAVQKLMGSPLCLYVFDSNKERGEDVRAFLAVLALCCVCRGGSVARGLVEQRAGFEHLAKTAKHVVDKLARHVLTWQSTDTCVDDALGQLAEHVLLDASRVFVHGISSGSGAASASAASTTSTTAIGPAVAARLAALEKENQDLKQAMSVDIRALQREHAELLVVLANQEMDRQALLQTILDMGGQSAVDNALERAAGALAMSFEVEEAKRS
jgi:hypothetical protein